MIFLESIKLAFKSIWNNKARSILTMIGIYIGISSVILLMSLGEGVKENVKGSISNLGSNLVFAASGQILNSSDQGGFISQNPANFVAGDVLTNKDVEEIQNINGIEKATKITMISSIVSFEDKTMSPMIVGIEPEAEDIMNGYELADGNFVTSENIEKEEKVIVISDNLKEYLFEDNDQIIGKNVKLVKYGEEIDFKIVGFFKKPSSSGMFSTGLESMSVIPYSTAQNLFNDGKVKITRISAKVNEDEDSREIAQKVEEQLLKNHRKEEFTVMTQDDMIGLLDDVLSMLTSFIAAVAAISLLVGGVGIMNIMLVSVTERTREIGLRKAVGANNFAILIQFLIEAIILSAIAGTLSIFSVRAINEIISRFVDIKPVISTFSILLSVGVCIGIGIVFGLAPAIKASKKDPIEALRYE